MRSGVVAQKMGMTRLFTDGGEHVPVTVLRLAQCQVIAHRSKDKNGYVALQLGSGERRAGNMSKADRGYFAAAKVEPKRKLAEFRVSDDALIPVGAEITADHFVEGQFVDVCGISIGKGFAGGMKRWNFGGLRASHGVSISHRSIGSTGGRQDPGKTFKNKKMPGHMGSHPHHHLEPQGRQDRHRARPGHGRRRGAGLEGRLDHLARRHQEDAAQGRAEAGQVPASPKLPPRKRPPRRRANNMDMKITTLEGKEAGSVSLSDAIFGLEPRADIIQRCVNWQLARRQRGTHKTKDRSEIWRTGKKMYGQKGTGGARHGSARVPQFRGGGRAFGPVVRSHAIDLPKKVRALALKHALSSKAKDGGIIVIDKATLDEGEDQVACSRSSAR